MFPLHIQCVQGMGFCGDLIEVVAAAGILPRHTLCPTSVTGKMVS